MKILPETANTLPLETRERVTDALNRILANLTDLHSQTKHAHWNVRGPLFYSLHKLFDELAATVEQHIDPLAERITALGGVAEGTIRLAAARSSVPDFPEMEESDDDLAFVVALIDRFGNCAAVVGRAIDEVGEFHDSDTVDLLTGVSRDLDKSLWFLEAHRRR